MLRHQLIHQLQTRKNWDICIIGGGATGLGIAVDAASRGYNTILIEKFDYAKGTSSRSTKLVHGGVRYLQHGNIKLVLEALKERGILKKNAAHLVKDQSFIVPNYKWWQGPYYGMGLKLYDWMSGNLGLGPSEFLSKEEVLSKAPTLEQTGLRGGILYHDGQFDDARLAINLAQTAAERGALMLNYVGLKKFIKKDGLIIGVVAEDTLNGDSYEIISKVVINATGVFSDKIQQLDEPGKPSTLSPSQGIHIVLERSFLPGDTAILVPQTDDGRVIYAVPWHNRIIIGTTDTKIEKISSEPVPLDEEIGFLLDHISRYLTKDAGHADIKSMFAGLRPLIRANTKKTSEIARDHIILQSGSGLFSIIGGKWTTYRKMAEDVLNEVIAKGKLEQRVCITETLSIHGNQENPGTAHNYYYGSDNDVLEKLYSTDASLKGQFHPLLNYTKGHVIHAIRNEFALTIDDVLARRTRALLLDAFAAKEAARVVGEIMRAELNETNEWLEHQLIQFEMISSGYLPINKPSKI